MLALLDLLSASVQATGFIGTALFVSGTSHFVSLVPMGSSLLGLILVMGFAHSLCDYPLQIEAKGLGEVAT